VFTLNTKLEVIMCLSEVLICILSDVPLVSVYNLSYTQKICK
jgi:hypothetical protein